MKYECTITRYLLPGLLVHQSSAAAFLATKKLTATVVRPTRYLLCGEIAVNRPYRLDIFAENLIWFIIDLCSTGVHCHA